jgi:hypothetical protein
LAVRDGEPADQEGFSEAFSKTFGNQLVPNQPQLVQIRVQGFAVPNQLILIEAQCIIPSGFRTP